MVDILRLGSNSLLSLQQAMNTTGHNIANVNTDGFSRQSVNFTTANPQNYGFGYVGQGSVIESIDRAYNSFLTSQVQDFTSTSSQYEMFAEFSSRVDNILADSENSLNTSLQNFFSSISDVASNPSGLPERQVLIGEANNLVERQQSFNKLLQDLNNEVNNELRLKISEVNGLADSISNLNKQIVSATGGSASAPNDLLDQRDLLIKKLSENISVTTNELPDGSVNVFVGKGQSLVVGSQTTHLKVQANAYDSSRLEVVIDGQQNTSSSSELVNGGKLQGLLDFRSRVLVPAQTKIGLVALGLSESFNALHQTGLNLDGEMGGQFFSTGTINVAGNTGNAGSASPAVSLDDVSNLRASDYLLDYNGTQWQLTRLSDNTSVSGTGSLSLDGMTVDVSSGTPATGDSFILNPARTAAANFNIEISDPRKIAAASPVISSAGISNLGAAGISEVNVSAVNTLPLSGAITLTFNPDALGAGVPGFDVVGGPGGVLAYDPATEGDGKTFNFPGVGLEFSVSDVPQAGDTFVINSNVGASGDNRNALKLGDLQHQNTLNGAQDTFQDFYGSMVAQVGVTHRQATSSLSVEASLLEQAEGYRDSVSGVNLDEEAANLLRYQQAYQASAQLIKVAEEVFQTLLSSIR